MIRGTHERFQNHLNVAEDQKQVAEEVMEAVKKTIQKQWKICPI